MILLRPRPTHASSGRIRSVSPHSKTGADSLWARLLFVTGQYRSIIPRARTVAPMSCKRPKTGLKPQKGEASYWKLRAGNGSIENALWSYEQLNFATPINDVKGLRPSGSSSASLCGISLTRYLSMAK